MENPVISVITVCFNAEREIERTMRSVLDQTYENLEYIIVDGASTDGTVGIVKHLAFEYSNRNIRIISEVDNGIYDAMNKGVSVATGDWLNMMNAGDVFTDSMVLTKVFDRDIPSSISFIYSDAWIEDHSVKKLHITNIHDGVVLHQASIYRKALHNRFGLYLVTKPIIISDYLFFCHIPEEEYLKIEDVIIAIFGLGGISSQRWCFNQKLCADVIFNKISMGHAVLKYLFNPIIIALPESWRVYVKHHFFKRRG